MLFVALPFVSQDHIDLIASIEKRIQEIPVALPHGKSFYFGSADPLQFAFVTIGYKLAFKARCTVEIHILIIPHFGDEPDHSEETVFGKLKSGLFRNLTLYAVIGRLAGLALSSYADPLSGIGVVFLFIPV